jgi:hypothetical protein
LAGDFWLIFTFLGVTMSQKSSAIQIASLVAKVLTPDTSACRRRAFAAAHQPAGWQKPVRGISRATRSIAQPRTKAANFTSGFC